MAPDRDPKQDPVLGRIEQDPVRSGNQFKFRPLIWFNLQVYPSHNIDLIPNTNSALAKHNLVF